MGTISIAHRRRRTTALLVEQRPPNTPHHEHTFEDHDLKCADPGGLRPGRRASGRCASLLRRVRRNAQHDRDGYGGQGAHWCLLPSAERPASPAGAPVRTGAGRVQPPVRQRHGTRARVAP